MRKKIIFVILLNLLCICVIAAQNIKSNVDKEKGEWVLIESNKYEYKINEESKKEILIRYRNGEDAWRSNKILLALSYAFDIDKESLDPGSHSAGIEFENENIIIRLKDKTYRIMFESYESIYFPLSLEILKKEI